MYVFRQGSDMTVFRVGTQGAVDEVVHNCFGHSNGPLSRALNLTPQPLIQFH